MDSNKQAFRFYTDFRLSIDDIKANAKITPGEIYILSMSFRDMVNPSQLGAACTRCAAAGQKRRKLYRRSRVYLHRYIANLENERIEKPC